MPVPIFLKKKLQKHTYIISCSFQLKWILLAVKHQLLYLFTQIMISEADYHRLVFIFKCDRELTFTSPSLNISYSHRCNKMLPDSSLSFSDKTECSFSSELGLGGKNCILMHPKRQKGGNKRYCVLCLCFRLSIRDGQKPLREPESF